MTKEVTGILHLCLFLSKPKIQTYNPVFAQNRGIVEVERDLWRLSSPATLLNAGLSKQILKINYLSLDVYNDTN